MSQSYFLLHFICMHVCVCCWSVGLAVTDEEEGEVGNAAEEQKADGCEGNGGKRPYEGVEEWRGQEASVQVRNLLYATDDPLTLMLTHTHTHTRLLSLTSL